MVGLIALYIFINRPQRVIVADAGPTRKLTAKEQKRKSFFTFSQSALCSNKGVMNTRNFIRVYVDGTCMEPRGIKDGAQVLVKPLDKKLDFNAQVKEEDVLLIHLHDKKVYRLRILQDTTDINSLVTYRYKDGVKHNSSRNHKHDDVVGVVKYIIS